MQETDLTLTLDGQLASLDAKGRLRSLKTLKPLAGHMVEIDSLRCLNLASNDYLSFGCDIAAHREFRENMSDADSLAQGGFTASASRLLGGEHPAYAAMEELLESAYGPDKRALVLNSGYHANIGILPALAGKDDLILSDKLNHASIIDGIKLSRAAWLRYRHADMNHLRELLATRRTAAKRIFVITESIFSMDGDCADLPTLRDLKREFGFVLYVDEAHALGVRGRRGLGLCEETGILPDVDILVGTFGKALASTGAFVVSSATIRDYLVNTMRSLIFTTALPPVVLNWSRYIFQRVLEADDRRARLARNTALFRQALGHCNLPMPGSTHIVPLVIGRDAGALELADSLKRAGFLAPPIRPPTVPEGTARLRFSLGANMDEQYLRQLAEHIVRVIGAKL